MATGFDNLVGTALVLAIGKARVGAPPPPPAGKTGVIIRVAIFFDGTKNNRSNTTKRLNDKTGRVLKTEGKDGGTSYGNFYSNPAIHEFMNKRRLAKDYFVSHYVEGIGTRNFVEGATRKVKKRELVRANSDPFGGDNSVWKETEVIEAVPDEENGQDDMYGNGFGAGPTGIIEKVDSGIEQLRIKIIKARGDVKDFYIQKIIFDVFGFSRGAAAARHFISRRDELSNWPKQRPAELVINFVGLYDTVSSYAKNFNGWASAGGRVAWQRSLNTDHYFCDDVKELGLDLGSVPKRVIHLTAGDEHRQNFSLTNINTSLKAGVGFEMTLPGVHSDVGGSYVEAGQGALNVERRRIANENEKSQLVAEGWYTDGSPGPDGKPTPNQFKFIVLPERMTILGKGLYTKPFQGKPNYVLYGIRSLPTDYQFITLKIMHEFATCGGKHEALNLATFDEADFTRYKIPPALAKLGRYFCDQALARQGSHQREIVSCPTPADTKWLRNHYLHRSTKLEGDEEMTGMEPRADVINGRLHSERLIIPDDDPNFVPPSLRPEPPKK